MTAITTPNQKQPWRLSPRVVNFGSLLVMLLLILVSVSVGVADFSWQGLFSLATGERSDLELLLISRLPRTLAIILTGVSMSVAGMMMQVILKNRFVEPSMVGATQSAAFGMLAISLLVPTATLSMKMAVATLCALGGMVIFMRLIRRLPATDYLMIPLVGIVFSGIIEAITTFIAYQTETLQLLSVWTFGDFSGVLAGRYEMLWLTGVLCAIAYVIADKLTIVGLGDTIAKNLGVNREAVLWAGISMVAMISAVVVITVGAIPFVGLVVPNIISRMMGDQLKRTLPAVALLGASAVLLCDIIGRTVRYPFEVPVATVFGVLGAAVFLWLLFRKG
ncbi:iron ABC transporter permease [Moraxella caviae]|uniref:Iron ABC transporter permease n=1 Tax=Moraxella caviae TaxID=34060 RepID=A0A1T0A8E3_9GAMM|nr:iron chelate uptake ABC transporter family permease subunit [Moraxella caviae]OOR91878.1 iron ABC transporter permease [Moraxella caviae]STZ09727.1 Iron-uptake system permease protein FeuB [Moraxella caviae]